MSFSEKMPPSGPESGSEDANKLEDLKKRKTDILFWMNQPDGHHPDDARVLEDIERQIAALENTAPVPPDAEAAPSAMRAAENQETLSPEERIAAADSFEALYEVLRAIGPIQGSREVYEPEHIIDYAERVRGGARGLLDFITRTHDIRAKVEELLGAEKGQR